MELGWDRGGARGGPKLAVSAEGARGGREARVLLAELPSLLFSPVPPCHICGAEQLCLHSFPLSQGWMDLFFTC